jgi:hypothetical protein
MMKPSQALRELFEQHDSLRVLMDNCEQLADQLDADTTALGRLVQQVARLRVAFEAHNRHEEHMLPSILRDLDAFGDVRVRCMMHDHASEHSALRASLDGPAAELRATLSELRAHLAAEERIFLSARILRDDVVNVESTG